MRRVPNGNLITIQHSKLLSL